MGTHGPLDPAAPEGKLARHTEGRGMLALYAPILGTRATRAYAFWARRGLLNEGAAVHARLR